MPIQLWLASRTDSRRHEWTFAVPQESGAHGQGRAVISLRHLGLLVTFRGRGATVLPVEELLAWGSIENVFWPNGSAG